VLRRLIYAPITKCGGGGVYERGKSQDGGRYAHLPFSAWTASSGERIPGGGFIEVGEHGRCLRSCGREVFEKRSRVY
jgi:hypothetical protein